MRPFLIACFMLAISYAISSSPPLLAVDDTKPLTVSFTYGLNGIIRTDDHYLPGEQVFMTVAAHGHNIPKDGICQFTARYSINDKAGKTIFTNADDDAIARMEAGAPLVKLLLRCELSTQLEPGTYEFVTELRDKKTRETYRNRQPITILPEGEFTLSQFAFAANVEGTAPLGTTIETCHFVTLHWATYAPQSKDDQWHIEVIFNILDENGRSYAPPKPPQKMDFPVIESRVINSNVSFAIENPGEYTAVATVKDLVSGKTATRSIPFRVVPSLPDILPAPAQ